MRHPKTQIGNNLRLQTKQVTNSVSKCRFPACCVGKRNRFQFPVFRPAGLETEPFPVPRSPARCALKRDCLQFPLIVFENGTVSRFPHLCLEMGPEAKGGARRAPSSWTPPNCL